MTVPDTAWTKMGNDTIWRSMQTVHNSCARHQRCCVNKAQTSMV